MVESTVLCDPPEPDHFVLLIQEYPFRVFADGGSRPKVGNIPHMFLDMAVDLQSPVLPMENAVFSRDVLDRALIISAMNLIMGQSGMYATNDDQQYSGGGL